ncbi:Splicing factor-like protein [Trema orientale]|uniref:Splicing factor-like protein n=1 Tax=Trema orientale TaxID=63057 RepID=A0A2P5E6B4_TREOI|nr:Splicing factor-like protein [Trema orientale]
MAAKVAAPPGTRRPPPPKTTPCTDHTPLSKVSLYVGDLHPRVDETDLIETFRFMGPIASVRLCRDFLTGKSLRYAYINFFSHTHASKALDCLNHTEIKGKPIRIMWSQRDPFIRKTGVGNIFVKNLDHSITSAELQDMFCNFGNILSCKVAEENGKSKGFGFVQFGSEDSAIAAVGALHNTEIKGKKLYVSKFVKKSDRTVVKRSERTAANEETSVTNLFVKNLDRDINEDLLRDKFSRFGKVSSLTIIKDYEGNSRGFGFVELESRPEEAKNAIEVLNGSLLGSKHLFVEKARKKAAKEKLIKGGHKMFNCHFGKGSNLFVKNLHILVDDSRLKDHFSCCGKVTSVRVMRDKNGISSGFGFVCFSTHEEAKRALQTLDGTILEGRSLCVTFAWQKEYHPRESKIYCPQLSSKDLDHPNWDNASCSIPLVYYNFTPSSPFHLPLKHQPPEYVDFGSNVGHAQYPFLLQNYLNQFSTYVPLSQMQPGNQILQHSQSCVLTNMSYGTRGVQKTT